MTAEKIVDNPVPRPGGAGDLQGFLRGQGSTALSEQIPEFPDPGGGREDFQPVQGSAVSPSDSPGLVKGVLALFPGRKKVRRSRAPRGRNWVRTRAHGRRELCWGLLGGTTWSAASSPCCCVQEWCFLVCSSGPPSYPVAWSSCWCRLCLATRPSWRLLEEFPLLRALCRAIRTWKSGPCLRP